MIWFVSSALATPVEDAALFTDGADDVAAPIINGGDAATDDFPMTGGLLAHVKANAFGQVIETRMFVCSSTLIAPDVVLLAAHCVDPDTLNFSLTFGTGTIEQLDFVWSREADLTAFGDTTGMGTPEWPEDAVSGKAVWHEGWVGATAIQMGLARNDDIALVFLDEPVFDVPFAVLPTAEEAEEVVAQARVDVVGWGQSVATQQFAPPPPGTYAIKQMGESHVALVGDSEFQVGKDVGDVRKCHGDSGGPSFMHVTTDSAESMRLVGVTSHAFDATDCHQTGGVDTRVDFYLDWIDEELRSACEDGRRSWCEEPGIPSPPDEEGNFSWEGDAELSSSSEKAESKGCATSGAPVGMLALLPLLPLFRRR